MNNDFYTIKGYQIHEEAELTSAMEDYLEMICRIEREKQVIKAGDLSKNLHVKPSSATKMLFQLNECGCIIYKKYGDIVLTEKGRKIGEYLLYRHDVVLKFLNKLNNSDNKLEEAEKIEHFLKKETVENLDKLIEKM